MDQPRGPQPGDTVRVEVWGHVTERTGNTVRIHLECPPDVQRDVDTVVITQRRGETGPRQRPGP